MCSHSSRLNGKRFVRRRQFEVGPVVAVERGEDRFDLDRLGEVLDGPELDRIDCGGDAGVAGEDDDAAVGPDRQ